MSKRKKKKTRRKISTASHKTSLSISLCMIVKNEEEYLPQCLESVKSMVDEMVIVDTGSTDRTVEIAESFGAKILHHPWNNDFAEARNVSLRHAACAWILVLDADEMIEERDLAGLRNVCGSGKFKAYSIVTRNYNNDSKGATWVPNDGQCEKSKEFTGWSPSRKVRLFRNNSAIRFSGMIHELVEPSIRKKGWKIGICDVPVHHFGRARQEETQEAKGQFYFKLIQKTASEKNRDPDAYFKRGAQGSDLGYHEEAVRDFYRVKELAPLFPRIDSNLSASLIHLERYDEAIGVLKDGIQKKPDDAGLWNNLGLAYYVKGIYDVAVEKLEKAVRLKPDYAAAYKNLGMAYAQAGRIKDAISAFTKAFKLNPTLVEIKKTLEKLKEMDDSGLRSSASTLLPPAPPTLSLCMIVKNEEEYLPQCLESVKSIVDEMVIVDTGSTDRTVEIAESFGAKVFHHPWNNDFAEARNVSLRRATCDWILVLDADEVIAKRDLPRIRPLLSNRNAWAYKLTLRNYELTSGIRGNTLNSGGYEEGRGFPAYGAVDLIRLFRNRQDISFEGRVHELITLSALVQEEGLAVVRTGIPVHHYGKVMDREKVIRKAQIYREIGEKKILDNPKDAKALEDLGAQYIELGNIDNAEKVLKQAIEIDSNRCGAWFNLGVVYAKRGQWIEALEPFVRAIELNPKDADSRYNCGLVLEKIGQTDAAIEQHSEAIALNPDYISAHFSLGNLRWITGNREKAAEHYEKVVKLSPTHAGAHFNLGLYYEALGQIKEAIACFKKTLKHNPDHSGAKASLRRLSHATFH
jgi:glycosyltransferase involved in cell wall biosynthesis